MRPPKSITVFVLALTLVQTTGCHSFLPLKAELPTAQSAAKRDPTIRVQLRTGESRQLFWAYMDSVAIQGGLGRREGQERTSIPLSEVVRLEERHFDGKRTGLLTLAIVGILGGLVAVIANNSTMNIGFSGLDIR